MEVTAPACPFSLWVGSFYLFVFMSHILTVLFTEPAAINFDFGENMQALIDEGS